MNVIRILTVFAMIAAPFWLLAQWAARRITRADGLQRLGFGHLRKDGRPVVWLHAASLGELASVRPVVEDFRKRHTRHRLLITTTNPAALKVARSWVSGDVALQAAPLDLPGATRRFLTYWKPVAFINVEAELWPNRFAALSQAGVRSIFLNARFSDRTTERVSRMGLRAFHLQHFTHFFAQNAATTANLQSLGIAHARIETTPNLKSLVRLPDPDPALARNFVRAQTVLAASTHAGEEEAVLAAFAELRKETPRLRLILVPRHADRAAEVMQLVTRAGLNAVPMSGALMPGKAGDVLVADKLGVQPGLYGLAAVVFVGGSLPEGIGGHTPYEPIRAGCALVSGPHTFNFAAEYIRLRETGGCVTAATPGDLAQALGVALRDADALARRAADCLPPVEDPDALFRRIGKSLRLGA